MNISAFVPRFWHWKHDNVTLRIFGMASVSSVLLSRIIFILLRQGSSPQMRKGLSSTEWSRPLVRRIGAECSTFPTLPQKHVHGPAARIAPLPTERTRLMTFSAISWPSLLNALRAITWCSASVIGMSMWKCFLRPAASSTVAWYFTIVIVYASIAVFPRIMWWRIDMKRYGSGWIG